MGKGGYNGGSTVVGFSGSGWVGRGSITMQPATKKGRSAAPAKKKPRAARLPTIPPALVGDEELQRLSRRVKAIEADIRAAKSRIGVLNKQLQLATDQLKTGLISKIAKPKPNTKASQES
ncbi:hypothetical protein H5J25_19630 (plasmid) [Sphingomonas aliaeris]|uniref:Uncharacterized protein n=1 Tax=Sphingomonas aliaeris TaxID=2759526 RepID=A0A974NYG9_9SPHN|nr:hypothetical protein [Sphingomonas aliaeris]QQV79260.1 hypothetical protein H5J25_19630 [Sphingomonas aliaeris]